MHKTKSGSSLSMTNTRPPKPPCWLDLKVQQQTSSDEGGSKSSPVGPQPSTSVRASRPTKRPRARIHRTRSEYCIQQEELPDCDVTLSLADTDPEDIGLRSQSGMDETTKKCQSWLESIEGCGPPEGTGTTGLDIETVELEVPDDTLWYDEPRGRSSHHSRSSRSHRDKHKHDRHDRHDKHDKSPSDSRITIPGHLFDFSDLDKRLLTEQQLK